MGKYLDQLSALKALDEFPSEATSLWATAIIRFHSDELAEELIELGKLDPGKTFKDYQREQVRRDEEAAKAEHLADVPLTMEEMWARVVSMQEQIQRLERRPY